MAMTRNYKYIKAHGGHGSTYEAVHEPTGIRSHFKVVEHMNLGQAWMMRDTKGMVPNIVVDDSLIDVVFVSGRGDCPDPKR
ncbi:hypothetical protein [Geopseudomonas aromaticivorans]